MKAERTHSMDGKAQELYGRKADAYVRFVSSFGHRPGIEALLFRSGLLRDKMRVLDAGCGTGLSTFALMQALRRHHFSWEAIHAFDLTPAMLTRFRAKVDRPRVRAVELRQADVLRLDLLPDTWTNYDLIISVSMLEYVARLELVTVLASFRQRLSRGGTLVVVITRRNPLTWLLIEKWWKAQRYSRAELAETFAAAEFAKVRFERYPLPFFWLSASNHVVFASGDGGDVERRKDPPRFSR